MPSPFAFHPRRIEDWIVWSLRAWLIAGAAWYLATPTSLSYVPSEYLSAITIGGILGGAWLGSARGTRLVRAAEAAWLALFLMHFLGHSADLYRVMPAYDMGVHFTGGILGGLVVLALGVGTKLLWDRPAPFRVAAAVLGLVALGGITVEVVEYEADAIVGTAEQSDPLQGGLEDTMTDLLASTAAAILVAVGGALAQVARAPAGATRPAEARAAQTRDPAQF